MISFFSKKKFLVDYLDGFIDMHNHILPGIDDGAKTVEESISLIRGLSQFGVTKFISTPHIMNNYYPNTPETINNSLLSLKNELLKQELKNISIDAAAEHMIDDNFEYILDNEKIMPLKKKYILTEMSYIQPPLNFDQVIFKIANKGYKIILAHPERYGFLHQKMQKYDSLKKREILFQMNILSLSDFYGKNTTKIALKLIDQGYINFLGTDVHNHKQLSALKDLIISEKVLKALLPIISNTVSTFY